jgi:hypoxanthine phosphoribosyltransferase
VLLVEDIVTRDSARYLLQTLAGRAPNSLGIVTMLDLAAADPLPIQFRCFEIPDYFVIGCGLDYSNATAICPTSR